MKRSQISKRSNQLASTIKSMWGRLVPDGWNGLSKTEPPTEAPESASKHDPQSVPETKTGNGTST